MHYILDCMFYIFTCLHGGNNAPLQSTGEPFTLRDLGVALLSWLILMVIILLLIYLIKYSINKRKISSKEQDKKYSMDDVCKNKYLTRGFFSGIVYIFECILLGILCVHGGMKRPMYTTGKIPTSKDVSYCIMGWIIILLIFLSIIFILI